MRIVLSGVPGAWRPLLDGGLRDQALEAVRDIAEALRKPPEWGEGRFDEATRASLRLLLNTGIPGHALLFADLAQAGVLDDAREAALDRLETIAGELPRTRLDPWLLKGFAGVGWVNRHVRERLFDIVGDGNDAIDAALLRLLRRPRWRADFDLLYGLVGLGVYALERLPRRDARAMLGLVVRHLGRLAEHQAEGIMRGKKEAKKADKPRRKLALRKETLRDLDARARRADQVKGGPGSVNPRYC